jgi:hypothetical protein
MGRTGYHPVSCEVDSVSSGYGLAEEWYKYGIEPSDFIQRVTFLG